MESRGNSCILGTQQYFLHVRERTFHTTQKLISSTDLMGKIQHGNQAFVDLSGFSYEELIGQMRRLRQPVPASSRCLTQSKH
ncbi:PAS domain S-box protein [Marinobacter sp. F3R08]|uniref:PAS domain S-box protein n=1 Tax=Marinobacter sp. F3R08 TaxID=2841559 RepID=UPI001C0A2343|nr:PAS domain S-box protein [Marinobacter sp. F3R08]